MVYTFPVGPGTHVPGQTLDIKVSFVMLLVTQIALLFGGILVIGLALTLVHDLLERAWTRRLDQRRSRSLVVRPMPLARPASRATVSAPVLTVRLRPSAEATETQYPNAA